MFTGDQAREALIIAGIELMAEAGRPGSVGQASFSEAIGRSRVPRPSAYRLFGTDQLGAQVDFENQVAIAIVTRAAGELFELDGPELRELIADAIGAGAIVDSDELTPRLAEAIQLIGSTILDPDRGGQSRGMYLAAMAGTLARQPDAELDEAVRRAHRHIVDRTGRFLDDLLDAFGLRLVPAWSAELLATSIIDTVVGATLSSRLQVGDHEVDPPARAPGGTEPWTRLSLHLAALISAATEPDPRRVASAQLDAWLNRTPEPAGRS